MEESKPVRAKKEGGLLTPEMEAELRSQADVVGCTPTQAIRIRPTRDGFPAYELYFEVAGELPVPLRGQWLSKQQAKAAVELYEFNLRKGSK